MADIWKMGGEICVKSLKILDVLEERNVNCVLRHRMRDRSKVLNIVASTVDKWSSPDWK